MGTGQMLITIGAIILLGTVILNTNRGISNSTQVLLRTNFGLESISYCSSTIDEAESLPFDQSVINGVAIDTAVNQLTTPANLGEESATGDSLNDFDDYNGHKISDGGKGYRIDSTQLGTGWYKRWTQIKYVNFGDLSVNTTNATWIKRLDVKVWNTADSANSVVEMFAYYTYWYYK